VKIETEIPDINRDEVIESMARQLLTEWHEETDPETGPTMYRRDTNDTNEVNGDKNRNRCAEHETRPVIEGATPSRVAS
jgi:hypothetical protein